MNPSIREPIPDLQRFHRAAAERSDPRLQICRARGWSWKQTRDVAVADVVEERGSVRVLVIERDPLASDAAPLRWPGDGGHRPER